MHRSMGKTKLNTGRHTVPAASHKSVQI